MKKLDTKEQFLVRLKDLAQTLAPQIRTDDGQWTVKGFIDVFKNIYTISSDTKIVSKILEIHLFPHILKFADQSGYAIVLADHQNYYPDISFVSRTNADIKFAIDLKTTYRRDDDEEFCNGFTLGSHGKYFIDRSSTKNIQFPYGDYIAHFCLGIIYSRNEKRQIDEIRTHPIGKLQSITSVIKDFQFFAQEKWRIASDIRGSGNTANIGSISKISDIIEGRGMFSELGEEWFDNYWMNYGAITVKDSSGKTKPIKNLREFLQYRGGDVTKIVPKATRRRRGRSG